MIAFFVIKELRHTLDETLSETKAINLNIREILDVQTEEWELVPS